MKKLFASVLLLLSVVVMSFSDIVPLENGKYIFQSTKYENVGLVVQDYNMAFITTGGTVYLKLNVDAEDNYYYFYTDGNGWVLVFFDDDCYGAVVTSDSKYGNYNIPSIFDSVVNATTEETGVFYIRNILCN